METREPSYIFSMAVMDLQNVGIQANSEAYGFSVILHDSKADYPAYCHHEYDGSLSMAVTNTENPPVKWFLRPNIRDIVDILINANELLKSGQGYTWLDALDKAEGK